MPVTKLGISVRRFSPSSANFSHTAPHKNRTIDAGRADVPISYFTPVSKTWLSLRFSRNWQLIKFWWTPIANVNPNRKIKIYGRHSAQLHDTHSQSIHKVLLPSQFPELSSVTGKPPPHPTPPGQILETQIPNRWQPRG
jgi:hypothetical protein